MTTDQGFYTLVDPKNGNLAFKVMPFEDNSHFDHLQRLNYYSIIWVQSGSGKLTADFADYNFNAGAMMSFSPYQPFIMQADKPVRGIAIQFHPDFFCIHYHQKEVACHGVLFNNIYSPPFITVNTEDEPVFITVIEQMKAEMRHQALAQYELLIAYLKVFLIQASRLKVEQQPVAPHDFSDKEQPFILQGLRDAIEAHYKTKHSAADYATLLNITPKALGKIAKQHFNKTLTSLISERIVIEAKRELYLTSKPVKTIAYELGFDDEYYFSRFFKTNTNVSPQLYRNTVGFAKAEAV